MCTNLWTNEDKRLLIPRAIPSVFFAIANPLRFVIDSFLQVLKKCWWICSPQVLNTKWTAWKGPANWIALWPGAACVHQKQSPQGMIVANEPGSMIPYKETNKRTNNGHFHGEKSTGYKLLNFSSTCLTSKENSAFSLRRTWRCWYGCIQTSHNFRLLYTVSIYKYILYNLK
jgi:hypothetical protein